MDDVRGRIATIPFAGAIEAGRVRRYLTAAFAALIVFAIWIAVEAVSLAL
ncbi:MAG: hypothetical protein KDC48_00425 [Planctomycetes bacterium]|nr:hypothetical protein [Planctomycetota bacterium]